MNVKSIIKMVALALAGVAALTAVGFGVKAIVDYTKEDLKTISPTFEVGNLGSDGKFVEDKSTLYTKEAFGCYGLQVKPDFDSTVNYQIHYYDILDNYISSTEIMSDGYSGEAPLNGAYARIVIEPKNDEDGKISLTEKVKYPKQLTFKVKKDQDINNRFVVFSGKVLQRANMLSDLVFEKNLYLDMNTLVWNPTSVKYAATSTYLSVSGGSTISGSFTTLSTDIKSFQVFEFSDLPSAESYVGASDENSAVAFSHTLEKKTKYIIITVYKDTGDWTDAEVAKLPNCFTITKSK